VIRQPWFKAFPSKYFNNSEIICQIKKQTNKSTSKAIKSVKIKNTGLIALLCDINSGPNIKWDFARVVGCKWKWHLLKDNSSVNSVMGKQWQTFSFLRSLWFPQNCRPTEIPPTVNKQHKNIDTSFFKWKVRTIQNYTGISTRYRMYRENAMSILCKSFALHTSFHNLIQTPTTVKCQLEWASWTSE